MITVVTTSYRVRSFLRECRIPYQQEAVGLTGFRVTFRIANLEDVIKWHEGVYHTQLVIRYMGLNTFSLKDTDDLRDSFLAELTHNHARHSTSSPAL